MQTATRAGPEKCNKSKLQAAQQQQQAAQDFEMDKNR